MAALGCWLGDAEGGGEEAVEWEGAVGGGGWGVGAVGGCVAEAWFVDGFFLGLIWPVHGCVED